MESMDGIVSRQTVPCWRMRPLHSGSRQRRTRKLSPLNNHCKIGFPHFVQPTLRTNFRSLGGPSPLKYVSSTNEISKPCQESQLDKALDVLRNLDQQGIVPSISAYCSLLKACGKRKALAHAKRLHAQMVEHGLESTRYLGEILVSTLVKCGGLGDALQVFHGLPQRTVFSWSAIISGYNKAGQNQEALRMYNCMKEEGVQPDKYIFISVLKVCGSLSDLEVAKGVHADVLKCGCDSDKFIGACLVDMYGKCGRIEDAEDVFHAMSQRNVVSWTALLTAYVRHVQAEKALQLYELMQAEGISPDDRTFVSVLQACGMLAEKQEDAQGQLSKAIALKKGMAIHAQARRKGYESDVFVATTLVSMYAKCGSIADATIIFNGLSHRNVVSWNAMITAFAQQGQAEKALDLYGQMLEQGVSPNVRTLVGALQACGMLAEKEEHVGIQGPSIKVKPLGMGKAIHADAQTMGYISNVFVGNTLITMYGKCGSIMDAQNVFYGLSQSNLVSWNALLLAYAEWGDKEKAFQLYESMQHEGVSRDVWTFEGMLKACSLLAEDEESILVGAQLTKVRSLTMGKTLLADSWKKGYDSNGTIASTLISLYGKCGSIMDAENTFYRACQRNLVIWTAMMSGYVEQSQGDKALQLYRQMQEEGVSPDRWVLVSALQGCCILADKEEGVIVDGHLFKLESLERGKAVHADARRRGHDFDVFVGSTLISMYGRCGSIVDAQIVFDGLSHGSVVVWNAMLGAYVQQGQGDRALQLYKQLQNDGLSPDEITLICILQTCSNIGGLDICKQLHRTLVSNGINLSPLLATALVHAYGRCASMQDAEMVFDALPQPDVVSWTALIAGYARQGDYAASLRSYEVMLQSGMKPNEVTFLSLLSVCSHAGLVDRGVSYFESMTRDYGIAPKIEHYVSIVDLLGRAGYFIGVEYLVFTMPMHPNLSILLCLLAACRKHGKLVLAKQTFDRATFLEPKHAAAYVLMSNIYADFGLWDHARRVNELRQKAGAWKTPGQSWVEHQQKVHTFLVDDSEHLQQDHLHDLIRKLSLELKETEGIAHGYGDLNAQEERSRTSCFPKVIAHQRVAKS